MKRNLHKNKYVGFKPLLYIFWLLIVSESCTLFRKPSSKRQNDEITRLINVARTYTGVAYKSGGTDYNGIDCSGLLWSSFKGIGLVVPRVSWQQAEYFKSVQLEEIQPGDLVFFVTKSGERGTQISHSGIVTEVRGSKEVIFIHASSSKGVREDNLYSKYWRAAFAKSIRAFN